jgi:hypothetical protein
MTPLYSQRDHSPANPGGFSAGLFELLGVYLFEAGLVIPAFPVLFGLALLPPRTMQSRWQSVFVVIFLAVVSGLIVKKHLTYMADYQRERAKPSQTPFERFEHLSDTSAASGPTDGQ